MLTVSIETVNNFFFTARNHALISLTKQFMLFHAYVLVHSRNNKNCTCVLFSKLFFALITRCMWLLYEHQHTAVHVHVCGVYTYCTLYTIPKRTPEGSHFTLHCTCRLEPIHIQQKLIFYQPTSFFNPSERMLESLVLVVKK